MGILEVENRNQRIGNSRYTPCSLSPIPSNKQIAPTAKMQSGVSYRWKHFLIAPYFRRAHLLSIGRKLSIKRRIGCPRTSAQAYGRRYPFSLARLYIVKRCTVRLVRFYMRLEVSGVVSMNLLLREVFGCI